MASVVSRQDRSSPPGREEDVCVVCGFGHEARREPEGTVLRQPGTLTLFAGLLALGLVLFQRVYGGGEVLGLVLAAVAVGLGGARIAYDALRDLLKPSLSVDFLIVVAAIGAFALGDVLEAAAIVFLYSAAEILEDYSEERVGRSIRTVMDLAPPEARVRRGGEGVVVPVEEVRLGDLMLVKPGERIAMDGKVRTGTSAVEESNLTGEAVPVEKAPGGQVFAGTVNQRGYLEVEVTRLAKDNTITRIVHMVEAAEVKKARTQRFVETFSLCYTPSVVAMAAAVALFPPFLLNQPLDPWVYRALILLLVACPCALVISTPVTMISALTSAARRGVLVKGGLYLEEMAKVDTLVLDKTGTVTKGRIRVTDVLPVGGVSREEVLQLAVALEARSEHHLAAAIVEGAPEGLHSRPVVEEFEALPGLGVKAVLSGRTVYLGSPRLFEAKGLPLDSVAPIFDDLQSQGKTVVVVGTTAGPLGVLGLADEVRPEAPAAVGGLRTMGIRQVLLLTGDSEVVARLVAGAIGADGFRGGMMPEDKAFYIRELQARGHTVAMVGDGVNDAPALATANVGVSMGAASSYIALETADVALMGDDVARLPFLFRLSQRSRAVLRQNVIVSVGVKVTFLLLTLLPALVLAPPLVTLWMAVLFGDMGTSLGVITNALRLGRP